MGETPTLHCVPKNPREPFFTVYPTLTENLRETLFAVYPTLIETLRETHALHSKP